MADFAARRRVMVDTQVRPSDVTKFPIIEAMLRVPREEFVPVNQREAAYVGDNIDLGDGRVVLEPRTLAKMLDALAVGPKDLVLTIGGGYGYTAALLSRLAEAVIAVEDTGDWIRDAEAALAAENADNVIVVEGDLAEGCAEHAPFDAILIEGGVERIPEAITDQLKDGGRIAALFMTGSLGQVRLGFKSDGQMSWREAFNAGAPVLPGFTDTKAFAL